MVQIRPTFVQARLTYLTASITDAEVTEILIDSFVDAYGNTLAPSDFPGILYLTLDPGLETEEIVSCTSFTVNPDGTVSLDTNIVRGLAAVYPYASGGTAESHAAGCVVLCSDNPQIYEQLLAYVEDVAISGSANASPTVKGIVQVPTAAQINAGTNAGSTGAILAVSPDQLALSIYNVQLPSATQKNALAGSAGTPGSGNLFITQADVSNSGASGLIVRLSGTQYPAGDGTQLTGIAIAREGGTGTDGALTQTSGTTTIAVSSASYFVKNYTSISLTSAANLTISGQPANGTILVLKSQGAVTLTTPSGTANVIDLSGLGASGGTFPGGTGKAGISSFGFYPSTMGGSGGGSGTGGSSTQGPAAGGILGNADIATIINVGKTIPLVCGSGGGGGGQPATGFGGVTYGGGGGGGGGTAVILAKTITANTGTVVITGGNGCATAASSNVICPGGVGGGALYIECGGALNFTGQISVAGTHGGNGTGGGTAGNGATGGSGTGGNGDTNTNTGASGGGGGAGALNAANGNAGSGGGGGASGTSYIGLNAVFA